MSTNYQLENALTGQFKYFPSPCFHSKKSFHEIMAKSQSFHAGNGVWFVRDAWNRPQITVFKVWFKAETSAQPQSDSNEEGIVDFCFTMDAGSFSSAVACMTNDTANYHKLLKMLMPDLSDEFIESQPTKP